MNFTRTHAIVLALTIAIALLRVASTHRILSATIDEQAHISSGYDWYDGKFTTDPTHPPLARLFFGVPLRMLDVPPSQAEHFAARGNDLLHHEQQYRRNLSWARRGNLLFLAIAIAGVALWGAQLFGATIGCIAAFLFSLLPPVLAHAGVATTDLSVAAALPFVIVAMNAWLAQRTFKRAAMLGLIVGFGLLTKFSFVPFCALVCLLLLATQWRAIKQAHQLIFAMLLSLVVVWAVYGFRFAPMSKVDDKAHPTFTRLAPSLLNFSDNVPIPAPNYFAGVAAVALHDREGHFAYLLGECRQLGWWYYFPVALFVKTPLAFLALALWGARLKQPLLIFTALLAYCMSASINIGIRHVLPLYAPLALLAALGLTHILRNTQRFDFGRIAAITLVAWLAIAGITAHPDYLAYFNETASAYPQRILVDSNLDWGQDLKRLSAFVRQRNIDRIGLLIATSDDVSRFGLVAYGLEPYIQPQGWIAVSHTALAYNRCQSDGYAWLTQYQPVRRIGRSMEVYWIP